MFTDEILEPIGEISIEKLLEQHNSGKIYHPNGAADELFDKLRSILARFGLIFEENRIQNWLQKDLQATVAEKCYNATTGGTITLCCRGEINMFVKAIDVDLKGQMKEFRAYLTVEIETKHKFSKFAQLQSEYRLTHDGQVECVSSSDRVGTFWKYYTKVLDFVNKDEELLGAIAI